MMRRTPGLKGHLPANGTTEEVGRKRGLLRSRLMILIVNKGESTVPTIIHENC